MQSETRCCAAFIPWFAAFAIAMTITGCASPSAGPPLSEADQAAWAKAFNAGDKDALLATYASEAILFPPNAPKVTGHDGVISIFGEGLKMGLKATQTKGTLDMMGDLAVRSGAYTLADNSGKEIDRGKYIEVWRRDASGWKMTHDMWNSDLPPAPATAVAEPASAPAQ